MAVVTGIFAILWIGSGIVAAFDSPEGRNLRVAGTLGPLGFLLNWLQNRDKR